MTQKSLTYVVIAVAVGYLLISAIPRQVAMYSTPQPVVRGGETIHSLPTDREDSESAHDPEASLESVPENMSDIKSFDGTGEPVIPSLIEYTRLSELMKWWTLDVLIALMIYWIARRRLV